MKDTPKAERKLWFKRRLFGWGWVPVTWEGWLMLAAWAMLDVLFAFTIDEHSEPREVFATFLLPIALITITLVRICYAYGEKPRWQWGKDLGDPQ